MYVIYWLEAVSYTHLDVYKRQVLFCLCLLVVILIVLQVFVVTSFKIPSDSMEPVSYTHLMGEFAEKSQFEIVGDPVEMKQAMKDITYEQCENLARATAERLKKDRK